MTGLRSAAGVFLLIVVSALAVGADHQESRALVERIDACVAEAGVHGNPADLCLGLHAQPCMDTPDGQTTAGMVQCIAGEAEAWDTILNREYQRLLPRLDAEQAAAMRKVQRAWIAFRDADCAFPHILIRGTLAHPWGADCIMQHTARRAMEIRGLVEYTEN
ncbi:DUF1311 domain-containing protein [Pikeienuella piscinae]|uniref:DUF1311 domain-containing protein n=2 Tax=Pikeienuella piscinae TaxID=2748098 RepID=A0A7M3T5R9_9RHOB|nr:DUF1311 domain-containing protein [Pikeienuella piscinae]